MARGTDDDAGATTGAPNAVNSILHTLPPAQCQQPGVRQVAELQPPSMTPGRSGLFLQLVLMDSATVMVFEVHGYAAESTHAHFTRQGEVRPHRCLILFRHSEPENGCGTRLCGRQFAKDLCPHRPSRLAPAHRASTCTSFLSRCCGDSFEVGVPLSSGPRSAGNHCRSSTSSIVARRLTLHPSIKLLPWRGHGNVGRNAARTLSSKSNCVPTERHGQEQRREERELSLVPPTPFLCLLLRS